MIVTAPRVRLDVVAAGPEGRRLSKAARAGIAVTATLVAIAMALLMALVPLPERYAAPLRGVPGWELTALRTGLTGAGVDRRELPIFTGEVQPGDTLQLVKVVHPLDLSEVAGVTLDRVWLAPVGGRQALVLGPGTSIRDSDVDGVAMQRGERIGIYGDVAGSYGIESVSVTGVSVGVWLDGEGRGSMTDTYVRGLVSLEGAHVDGFTRREGTGRLRIERCRIDASGPNVTGAFFLQTTYGGRISGVSVEDSSLEGEGYVVRLEDQGPGVTVGLDDVHLQSSGWGAFYASGGVVYTRWHRVRQLRRTGVFGAR